MILQHQDDPNQEVFEISDLEQNPESNDTNTTSENELEAVNAETWKAIITAPPRPLMGTTRTSHARNNVSRCEAVVSGENTN